MVFSIYLLPKIDFLVTLDGNTQISRLKPKLMMRYISIVKITTLSFIIVQIIRYCILFLIERASLSTKGNPWHSNRVAFSLKPVTAPIPLIILFVSS